MADATPKTVRTLRPIVLIAAGTTFYFLLLALMLYEIDHQHFTAAKLQLIHNNFPAIFKLPNNLRELAWGTMFGATDDARLYSRTRLEQELSKVVEGPTSIYTFSLQDPEGALVLKVEDLPKQRRMNTVVNCLFSREFSGLIDLPISKEVEKEGEPRLTGRLLARYASPPDYGPIIQLTHRYWLLSAVLVLVWSILYVFLFKYLLRPMQLVTKHLEMSRFERPRLIQRASGVLETSYNSMAAQAILQQLDERLVSLIRTDSVENRRQIVENALQFTREAFSLSRLDLVEMSTANDEAAIHDVFSSPPAEAAPKAPGAESLLSRLTGDDEAGDFNAASGDFSYGRRRGNRVVALFGQLQTNVADLEFRASLTRQAAKALARSVFTMRAHQQDIFRQRSEANIVLSRNLGHDLTNIIATTKLDLMAVKQLLDMPGQMQGGPRAALLRQSVNGLLESTRFLQEIVNIYRSFSYVKKPQYERHRLQELIGQFVQTFQPSVSARVTIRHEFTGDVPSLILEPRLIKLALFNLMSNALDAIKRQPHTPGSPSPEIVIRASYDPATTQFRIDVEDNGPGICDASGRPLERSEIDAIFEFGYSTKAERSEGLGLNWVRTIIEQFHAGTVRAENVPGGGARFTLVLQSMEASEARI